MDLSGLIDCMNITDDNRKNISHNNSSGNMHRKDVVSWDDYFMASLKLASLRSKDPGVRKGACVVKKNKIVGIGYSGMPTGCDDDDFPWLESSDRLEDKNTYTCHAEVNAMLNTDSVDLEGCTLYVEDFPCNECVKVIIQKGISEVIYVFDNFPEKTSIKAAKFMLKEAQVKIRQHSPGLKKISITMSKSEYSTEIVRPTDQTNDPKFL